MKHLLHCIYIVCFFILLFLHVPFVAGSQSVQTGKSYINISKPGGGVIENGNELEIRAVIAVSTSSIYFVRYNDTIPAGTTYKPNSIRFTTNEGMNYGTPLRPTGLYTDAGADDEARFAGGVLRVNIGSLTRTGGQTIAYDAVAAPAVIDVLPAASGCRISTNGRPSFYGSACIIMVTYRVFVNTAAGSFFTIPGGAFRYKTANTFSEATLPSIVRRLNTMNVMVTDPLPVCNATGTNSITGNGGNFGNGSTQNLNPAPAPGTVVPGYQWRAFAAPTNGPNDSMFTVANNTSPTGSTNNSLAYPNAARLFSVWDIIGDHTNAVNPVAGNPATPVGTNGGYMAVVNAAYGINNAVQQTVNGLCGDTYYEFSAWFRNICRRCSSDTSGKGSGTAGFKSYMSPVIPNTNDSAGVLPNLTFQVNGVDYYTTGNLDYNAQWVKKGFLFKTAPGQTSVNIVIRNNAPGGGGNDWVMDDVAFSTCLPGLGMRPSNNPTYCLNGEVRMSVIVTSFYSNYQYYQWERSTDGGTTWTTAPLAPTPQTLSYTYFAPDYKDTVSYPTFLASAANNGHKYRIRIATSLANLSNTTCAVYNTTDIITVNVNSTCDVLQGQLTFCSVTEKNGYAQIQWTAKYEQQMKNYIVESSDDGISFHSVSVTVAVGDTTEAAYMYTDPVPLTGKRFYRIKMVNTNDSYIYSKVLVVGTQQVRYFEIRQLINPVGSVLQFQFSTSVTETVEIVLTDALGKPIFFKKQIMMRGTQTMQFELPATLQRGSYMLHLKSASGVINKVVQKL